MLKKIKQEEDCCSYNTVERKNFSSKKINQTIQTKSSPATFDTTSAKAGIINNLQKAQLKQQQTQQQ